MYFMHGMCSELSGRGDQIAQIEIRLPLKITMKMGKHLKVLAIVASPKKDGNVSAICGKIFEGAAQNGHLTEMVNLYDYNVKYSNGRLAWVKTRRCSVEDDFSMLYNKEKEADIVIYGIPQ